ncbi:Protein AMN1 homolog [Geodia barretti]|uniref:Protein AMN1 homolog n=2 Tax=Geodia barretti TaxID=519541 RepID=A0AA35S808_GEOBA|nr:Protein AMN1 homolog [Geodia barretti]
MTSHSTRGNSRYLPGNVRTQLGKVMARRGLLCARNMPLVLHEGMYSLDLSESQLRQEEVGLVWRLCPRLKRLDIGVRRGTRDSLSTTALAQLLSHLPSLLSLNLQSCSLLNDATLLPLSSSSPYLTSLTLSGCSLVSDPSLLAIASRLSYLQALGLAYTQVSSVGLTALAKGVCAKVLKVGYK